MGFSLKKVGGWISDGLGALGIPVGDITDGFKDVGDWLSGEKAMEKQNETNVSNWNMVNAYNTPSAQMQRFMEAGLNPNLIYTQQNTASNVPGVSMPESGASILNKASSTASAIMGLKQMSANIANLRQQNENLKSQDTLLGAQSDYTAAQAERYRYDTNWLREHGLSSFSPNQERLVDTLGGYVGDLFNRVSDWSRDNISLGDVVGDWFSSVKNAEHKFRHMYRGDGREYWSYY